MRITILIDSAELAVAEIDLVSATACALRARGHEVIEARPDDEIEPSDVVIATSWRTVARAVDARGAGTAVHYCQRVEGGGDTRAAQAVIITSSVEVARAVRDRLGRDARVVPWPIDERAMSVGDVWESPPLRVGIADALDHTLADALRSAVERGHELVVVRMLADRRDQDEPSIDLPVEWHENLDTQARGDVLRSLHVFVGAKSPRAALEAMACGVPCVLGDTPDHRSLGGGQIALFVEPSDSRQFAEALALAAHPRLRRELRERGIETAARHTLACHARELETVFADLAQEAQPMIAPQGAQLVVADDLTPLLARALRRAAAQCKTVADLDALQQRLGTGLEAEIEHRRGLLAFAAGELGAAEHALRAALDGSPRPAEVWNDLGVVCFARGRHDDARRAFEQALALDPDHGDARMNLAGLSHVG